MGSDGPLRRCAAFWRVGAVAIAVALATAMFAGCGSPEYLYIANSDERTYVRIPSTWHEVDEKVIDNFFASSNPDSAVGQLRRRLRWSVAYDASDHPTAEHMISAAATTVPILYLTIRHLAPAEQSAVSYDSMRDSFTFVTESGRRTAASAGYDMSSFEVLQDEILPPGDSGLRGVRVIFNLELRGGVVHTFDQTVWANADSSTLYLLLIRCSATCYRERAAELGDIATSFTVRSRA